MSSSTAAATAAASSAEQQQPVQHGPKNHVRISLNKNKFNYVDLTKYLLNEGEETVELSGMGDAITNVVEITEILKAQDAVKIIKIETNRAPERPNGIQVDRIRVVVTKTDNFDKVFAEQMEEKKRRKEQQQQQQQQHEGDTSGAAASGAQQ